MMGAGAGEAAPQRGRAMVRAYDWIRHHATRVPAHLALVDLHSRRQLTYAGLDERVGRLASFLAADLGVGFGDRVAVLSHNTTDMLELQFACGRIGAVFVPLNWRLAVPELAFIVGDAAPRVLCHDVTFADAAAALHASCGLEHLVDMTPEGRDSAYERGIAHARGCLGPGTATHDDLSTIMYTSGTTGRPKGAMITHGMLLWNAVNLGGPAFVDGRTVHLSVLPLFHTGGINCYTNVVLHAGGTVAVMRSFDPARTLDLLQDPEWGFTHFFGVPAHYLFMSQQPGFAEARLDHLAVCGVGGAPCALAIIEAWATRGVGLQQGYGMTETSPSVLVLDRAMALAKAGSAGLPVLHNEVRLVDADGREVLGPDRVGELWVRGPNVTPGYWNRPDATAGSIVDGWLRTGDAARRDADGYYTIVDRWKDMYISGGENVYPAEVENVIYQMPDVAEVAVIGVPDERWGEVGQAVVVAKPGSVLAEADVLRWCAGRLARFKQPRSVRFLDALPRNATGKVLKRDLRG